MKDLSDIADHLVCAAYDALPELDGDEDLDRVVIAVLRALARHKAGAWALDDGPIDHWFPSVWARQELEAIASEIEVWSKNES